MDTSISAVSAAIYVELQQRTVEAERALSEARPHPARSALDFFISQLREQCGVGDVDLRRPEAQDLVEQVGMSLCSFSCFAAVMGRGRHCCSNRCSCCCTATGHPPANQLMASLLQAWAALGAAGQEPYYSHARADIQRFAEEERALTERQVQLRQLQAQLEQLRQLIQGPAAVAPGQTMRSALDLQGPDATPAQMIEALQSLSAEAKASLTRLPQAEQLTFLRQVASERLRLQQQQRRQQQQQQQQLLKPELRQPAALQSLPSSADEPRQLRLAQRLAQRQGQRNGECRALHSGSRSLQQQQRALERAERLERRRAQHQAEPKPQAEPMQQVEQQQRQHKAVQQGNAPWRDVQQRAPCRVHACITPDSGRHC